LVPCSSRRGAVCAGSSRSAVPRRSRRFRGVPRGLCLISVSFPPGRI